VRSTGVDVPVADPANDAPISFGHLAGTQVTESESHPDWLKRNLRPEGDLGGNFTTRIQRALGPPGTNVHIDTGWYPFGLDDVRYIYDGPISIQELAVPGKVTFPPFAQSSDAQLNAFGATAIAKCAPTRPTVNLAASLLETFHEGLPHLVGKATWAARVRNAQTQIKAAPSEFLNVEFGWLPLVSDVVGFVEVVRHLDKLISQYSRDNGKVVRRRFNFPPVLQSVESVLFDPSRPRLGQNSSGEFDFAVPRGRVLRRRVTTVNRWFSGAFVYHLPMTFFREIYVPYASQFQIFRRILGLELTPDVLWELTPWSWAVDWFSNVGDVVHNAGAWANDGLVMKYGYIMEHSIVRDTYTYDGATTIRGSSVRPPDFTLVSEAKVRRAANPFGFGLSMGGLSTLQKSILASVGLTRLK